MSQEKKEAALTVEELQQLCLDLIEHLDYCGWGDAWEREISEGLQSRAKRFQESTP